MVDHHKAWKERQKKEIEVAKEIYKKSKNFDSSINLDKMNVEIFDMLNEEDWDILAQKLQKLKEEHNLFSGK
jgi:two-component SAPR family response regulator